MKIAVAIILALSAVTAQAENITLRGGEIRDYKLAMKSFESAQLAEKHKDFLTACIYYRTASLHMISIGAKMDTNITNLKTIERAICQRAGV